MEVVKPAKSFRDQKRLDLYHIQPNLLIGSYPSVDYTRKSSLLSENYEAILSSKFAKTLIVDLVSERKPYIARSSNILVKHVNWVDYHSVAFQELNLLVNVVSNFLAKPNQGVFVHCKHGKGRTGTLVCAILIFMFRFTISEANSLFIQHRSIYHHGVQVHSQKKLLQYFHQYLSSLKPMYIDLILKTIAWKVEGVEIVGDLKNSNSRKLEISLANIEKNSKFSVYKFDRIGKTRVNERLVCAKLVSEDICFEIRHATIVMLSFCTFSINCAIEYLNSTKSAHESQCVIKVPFEEMDGVLGFGLKGKKCFSFIKIIISRVSL